MRRPQIVTVNPTTATFTSLPSTPGTYALILEAQQTGTILIGKLGSLTLQPGF